MEHEGPRFDPEGRNLRHTHVTPSADASSWRVDQVLVDEAMLNDWMGTFEVDLVASRALDRPVLAWRSVAPIG